MFRKWITFGGEQRWVVSIREKSQFNIGKIFVFDPNMDMVLLRYMTSTNVRTAVTHLTAACKLNALSGVEAIG
jgi:hypothetical protein